jgi:hypothetical protein
MSHFEGKWMEDQSTNHWTEGLASVIFSINTRTTFSTKKTPYQLVFGQDTRANKHYWESIYEAALDDPIILNDLIIDKIQPFDTQTIHEQTCPSAFSNVRQIQSG